MVVLTYDRPDGLRQCLNSIADMDKGDLAYEVIVVDDGSSVDNRSIVRSFGSQTKIRYYRKENGGVASARNTGLRVSQGRLVAFIADDYILPGSYLHDVADFLDRHPDAYVITHNIEPTGPSVFSRVQRLYFQLTLLQRFEPRMIQEEVVESCDLPPSRAAVFRRELFTRIGKFNEQFYTGEDGELGMRMSTSGIPVHFFPHKYVKHWECMGLRGYLQQRLRYGRSFFNALYVTDTEHNHRPSISEVYRSVATRHSVWRELARSIGRGEEYRRLTPFILVFLTFFYSGFYLQSRRTDKYTADRKIRATY